MNKHLPYKRVGLCELLSTETPYIVLRDGSIHLIDPEELKLLREILGEKACELKIPIIIEAKPGIGGGAFIVTDPIASEAISKLIGINHEGEKLIIYRPQVYELRLKLRTTTTIVFMPT